MGFLVFFYLPAILGALKTKLYSYYLICQTVFKIYVIQRHISTKAYYTEAVLANNITPKIMAIFIISKNSWGLHYSDRRFFIKTFWKGIFMQRGNSLLWNIQTGIVWSFTIISEVCKGKKLSPFLLSG